MCTVSFIPLGHKIFITSNRDEKQWRSPAIAPKLYKLRTGNALFPRDTDAGGTWLALHQNGNAIVFLNGGFIRHEPNPPYKKSRGVVLLDLLDSEKPQTNFLKINLENVEPFTGIILEGQQLFECRWDGAQKYSQQLDATQPYIWSSVTLYDERTIKKRKKWFDEWLLKNSFPSPDDILNFHQFTGDGDKHNDLLMDRNGVVFTVSITSLEINAHSALMKYVDVKNDQQYEEELIFTTAIASK